MARFLVKAVSAAHVDPVKDARGCYKRGDIVVIRPDGHVWGREETLPMFYQVDVSGLTVEAATLYAQAHTEPDLASPFPGDTTPVKRRRYRFRIEALSGPALVNLDTSGQITMAWSTARTILRDTVTGLDVG